jgi:uncharacterized protein with PIN domain
MFEVEIVIHDELNDFFSQKISEKSPRILNCERRSIKDLIESLGIPHTELGKIVVNGKPANHLFVVEGKSRIEVFPFRISGFRQPGFYHEGDFRFLCDVHLGAMARDLRLLGFDVAYNRQWTDCELAIKSDEEDRFILTRDRHLLMRKNIKKGLYIRNVNTASQVSEIINRLDLKDKCHPFNRCLACNGILNPAEPGTAIFNYVKVKIPEKVRLWCREYTVCDSCRKVYWKGSHYQKLIKKVADYLS